MRKCLSIICAAMLCMCFFALAACGGSSSASSSAASGNKFVGTWTLSGIKSQGLTLAGDFSLMFNTDMKISMVLEDGGKATVTYNDKTFDATWEEKGSDSISVKPVESADASASSASAESAESSEGAEGVVTMVSMDAMYKNGMLMAKQNNAEQAGDVTLIFTTDGKMADSPEISNEVAKPITSAGDIVGAWKLSGMNMVGLMMYGPADNLASMAGGIGTNLVFNEDGTAEALGREATWKVDDNGVTLTVGETPLSVKSIEGGNVVMDLTEAMGTPVIMMFSK